MVPSDNCTMSIDSYKMSSNLHRRQEGLAQLHLKDTDFRFRLKEVKSGLSLTWEGRSLKILEPI